MSGIDRIFSVSMSSVIHLYGKFTERAGFKNLKDMSAVSKLGSSTPSDDVVGGYDYKFVDNPPDRVICVICHLPSRNPHLSECCGHVFCKSCLDKTSASSYTACPMCVNAKFVTFCNKQIDREVKQLKVCCANKKKGCKWAGELNDIAGHYENSDGCQFEAVNCPNDCGKKLQRRNLTTHAETTCPLRKISCQHCHETGVFRFIKGDHKNECQKYPVCCPNKCGVGNILRRNLEAHRKECPLEVVNCEYYSLGCEVTIPRKRKAEHEEEDAKKHLKMTKQKLLNTECRLANLESNLHQLMANSKVSCGQLLLTADWSNHLSMLADISASSTQVCPVTLKMSDYYFHEMKGIRWYSNSFYTQHNGYMMRLLLCAGGMGTGKGTHLSVYLQLRKGEHDDKLVWPMTGKFVITLLNQLRDDEHYSFKLYFDENTSLGSRSRIVGNAHSSSWGTEKFFSNEDLEAVKSKRQFLKDNCIYVQVHMRT